MIPLVSIIIPVYNVEEYIYDALDSILEQTYKNLEILLIDDGSTDSSGVICDDYAVNDSRFKVIHQSHSGVSAARNVGLDHMSGSIVSFLDSDDAFSPHFIQSMLEAMISEKASIVVCNYVECSDGGQIVRHDLRPESFDRVAALNALIDGLYDWSVWNKLYDRALWDDVRFPEGQVYEDLDIFHKVIIKCDRLYTLPDTLYIKRRRPGSITTTYSKDNVFGCLTAYEHYARFVREHVPTIFTEEQYRRVFEKQVTSEISHYLRYYYTFGEDNYLNTLKSNIRDRDVSKCNYAIRIAFWMMRNCTWFIIKSYPYRYNLKWLYKLLQ